MADFDGAPGSPADLYLGRGTSTEAFFYRSEPNPNAGSSSSAINVRLAGGGGNPTDGHGAKIVVNDSGTVIGSQVLGAGAGRGSQTSALSTFGLGDGGGTYDVEVTWPDGGTQTHSVSPNNSYVFTDDTNPTIVTSTQAAAVTLAPGEFSVEFTWETEYSSRPELDKVHVSAAGGCWSGGSWIQATDPGVEHSVLRLASGRYLHTIRKNNISCSGGCIYTYYCSSATDFVTSDAASASKTVKILFCISGM